MYLTIFTVIVIFVANIAVYSVSGICSNYFDTNGISVPILTEYVWMFIENSVYLCFSILSILIVLGTQASKYKKIAGEMEQIVIGLHLVIVSVFLVSFLLPFLPMCANIV